MAEKKHGLMWWLFVSWWIWIFALPIYIIKQAKNKAADNQAAASIRQVKKDEAARARYRKYVDRHFELLNDEKIEYAAALKTGNFDGVIALCKEDFGIAPILVDYFKSDSMFGRLPHYPAFDILARIYDKQGNYQEACFVCQRAVALGYLDDGTQGGMVGRLEKMIKRAGLTMTVDEYIARVNKDVKHS